MKKKTILNLLLFVILPIIIVVSIYFIIGDNNLARLTQIIKIIATIGFAYLSLIYVRKRFDDSKYSYKLIISLAFLIFLLLNILRMTNLLIINWNINDAKITYMNTIKSFSYYAMLTLPFVLGLSIYSMITNIILIKKEGLKAHNVLGIVFAVFTLICAFSGQAVFEIFKSLNLSKREQHIKMFIDMSLNSVLSYYYTLVLSTLYCNLKAAKYKPKYDKDYIIILGCQVRKDGTPTPLLKGRVDRAIEFAKKQKEATGKDVIFIPSGGKGSDEILSEAKSMKNYLISEGIKEKNIIIEDNSVNTEQNMKFSKEKIEKLKKDGNVIYSTSDYHVFRSGVLAREQGLDAEGIGSPTKWYYYSNALIREFVANVMSRKKEHFILITFINVGILIIIFLGHHYHLI